MLNYQESDLDYKLCYDAHRGTSHVPDQRAHQEIAGYMAEMQTVCAEFERYAIEMPQNRAAIAATLEHYRQGYLKHLTAKLSAQSRVYSAFIAGPSNFPTARMEKRNHTLDKRREELLAWREKALKRMRLDYNPAAIERAPIRADEGDALDRLREKIAAAEKEQAQMRAVNKIVRNKKLDQAAKVEAIKGLGLSDDLLQVMRRCGEGKFPAYRLTNNNANIKRMKQRLASLQAEAGRPEAPDRRGAILGTPVTVIENRDETRLQLIFQGKPPGPVIAALKGRGFHWSRTEGAWQRLLNNNARQVVEELIG